MSERAAWDFLLRLLYLQLSPGYVEVAIRSRSMLALMLLMIEK